MLQPPPEVINLGGNPHINEYAPELNKEMQMQAKKRASSHHFKPSVSSKKSRSVVHDPNRHRSKANVLRSPRDGSHSPQII